MAAATYFDQVQKLYIAFYQRPADSAGLVYWAQRIDAAGGNASAVVNAFATSTEATTLYGAVTAATIGSVVDALYLALFNRAPDAAGKKFYVDGFTAGTFTAGSIALNVLNGASGDDAVAIANKLQVSNTFTAQVDGRLATDATFGQGTSFAATYNGDADVVAARNLLKAVTSSPATVLNNAQVTVQIQTNIANPGDTILGASGGQTFTLTAGVDAGPAFTGGAGNDTFNANPFIVAAGTTVATLTALDALDGGAGVNTLNVTDTTNALSLPASATVKNIQTANLVSSGTLTGNVSGWTGLTKVVATQLGGSAGGALTAAATTDVVLTDSAAAATTLSVQGGKDVTVTANGVTAGGTISVGTVTAVTGAVTVTANMLASQTGNITADAINVKGGTTVTVTANLQEMAGAGNTVTGGAIGVTGTSATTTVSVTQSAAATAAAAVVAATGVSAVTAVTAAPGQKGVTAVTAVTQATGKAAVAGVVDGAVTVTDGNFGGTTANSIKTVTLANYGATSKVESNALTDLSLSGTAGTLALGRAVAYATDSLNLTLNGLTGTNTITDTNNEIKTLNVTTVTADSKLAAFADTGLTTLNVAGSNVLTLDTANASLTKIAVSGAAGFNSDVSGLGSKLASFTTTSSGTITAKLDAVNQTFVGSTGQNVITISADAKKAITGGSGTGDVLVLDNTAATFGSATKTNVTGFEVLGTNGNSQGTFDFSTLPTGLKSIQMSGNAAGATTFTKVVSGAALAINAAQSNAVTYQLAGATGATESVGLTLGSSSNKTGFTVSALTLKDANDVGLGSLSVVSNASTFAEKNTITTLTDNGLSTLNVSGNGGLLITNLNQATTQATSFTINNTSTGDYGVAIGTLTDANLGALTFTGGASSYSSVTSLAGLTGKVLTLSNTGSGVAKVAAITPTATTAAVTETNAYTFVALNPGESVTVDGRTVAVTSGASAVSAGSVATAMSGGAVAAGLQVFGALGSSTAAAAVGAVVTFTSTTANTDVPALAYSDVALTAATVGAVGTATDGGAGAESTAWTMSALTVGQSYVLNGLTVTAQRALTGAEVAGAFTAGATSAGNFTVAGSLGVPATWTAPTFGNTGATLTLTNGANGNVTNFTTAPAANAAGTSPVDATLVNTAGSAVATGAALALQTITLNGNVELGANDNTTAAAAIGATTGVTVSGATDHAHVNINLVGAAAGSTDNITLGNSNNYITDGSTAGTVNVTVGTGGNLIDVKAGANNATFAANITLGAHTNTATVFNKILVSDTGSQATGISATITGSTVGDVVVFNNAADVSVVTITAAQQNTITATASLTAAITAAFGMTGTAHQTLSFQYGGDTYVIANEGADTVFAAGTDSVIKLTGLHTITDFGTANGAVAVLT